MQGRRHGRRRRWRRRSRCGVWRRCGAGAAGDAVRAGAATVGDAALGGSHRRRRSMAPLRGRRRRDGCGAAVGVASGRCRSARQPRRRRRRRGGRRRGASASPCVAAAHRQPAVAERRRRRWAGAGAAGAAGRGRRLRGRDRRRRARRLRPARRRPRSGSGSFPAAAGRCSCRHLVPLDRVAAPGVGLPALARGLAIGLVDRHDLEDALEGLERRRRLAPRLSSASCRGAVDRVGAQPDRRRVQRRRNVGGALDPAVGEGIRRRRRSTARDRSRSAHRPARSR